MDEYITCPECHNPRCHKDDLFCYSCGFELLEPEEEAAPVDDRQARYEEYKRSATGPLGRRMREERRDTVRSYTDVSGNAEYKLIVVGALSGFLLACGFAQDSSLVSGLLIAAAAVAFLAARFFAAKDRQKDGEDAFLRYRYDQLISEQVRWDRSNAERKLLDDMQNRLDLLADYASPEVGPARNVDEFRLRRILVEEYDTFEKQLQEDYWFSKAMHDQMK